LVQTKFEPEPGSSAGLVLGSACHHPAVWFWFMVQENTLQNQTELNFGNPGLKQILNGLYKIPSSQL